MPFSRFGFGYGPAAPPRGDLTKALQQRMVVLGYTPTPGGVYAESEQAVVDTYADQLGLEDRSDLNAVIAQVLPLMDSDIEVGSMWKNRTGPLNLDTVNITGRAPAGSSLVGLGLLALVGLYLATR